VSEASDWGLAIDYGTSFTAAAIAGTDGVEVLEVEDAPRFPSAVLLADDGSILTGRAALNQARRHPERYERTPKRLVGQPAALLGGRAVEVVGMVAAVLGRVVEAARVRQGSSVPGWVRLTHPAGWGPERCDVLRVAASRAGLGEVELLSEPEAAAWFFVEDRRGEEPVVSEGGCVAVYDLGGGTFDTAILRRSGGGFRLAGPPGGLDWFGGEDFDQRLYDWVLGRVYELDEGVWRALKAPESPGWRRARLQLREDVRQAKEALSTLPHVSVPVSKGEDVLDVEITRREFESLIEADLRRTVDILEKTARDAQVSRDEIAAVYLTGGSSRVPLAAALASEFHPNTYTRPDPKTLVAQGALAKPRVPGEAAAAAAPVAAPETAEPAPPPARGRERPRAEPQPLNRRRPRVAGRPVVGRTLTAKTGAWANGVRLSTQWLRRPEDGGNWEPVAGATETAYEVTEDDAGRTLAVRVSGTDGSRTEEVESSAVGPVRSARRAAKAPKAAPGALAAAEAAAPPATEAAPGPAPAPAAKAPPSLSPEPAPAAKAATEPRRRAAEPASTRLRAAEDATAASTRARARSKPPSRRGDREPESTQQPAAATAVKPRQRRAPAALPLVLAGGLVVAGVLGLVVGGSGSAGTETATPESFKGSLANDDLQLRYGDGWRRARNAEAEGPQLSDAVGIASSDGSGRIVAGSTQATGPTLLPAAFISKLDKPPSTDDAVRLGKTDGYRYAELSPKGSDRTLRLYVVPTTGGIATIECSARPKAAEGFWPRCETVATTLRLKQGEALPLGPSEAYAKRVDQVLGTLAKARTRQLRELRAAKRPGGQADAAGVLAAAYRRAASSLSKADVPPQAVPANKRIVRELRAVASAYSDLASAARSDSSSRWNAARRAVKRREAAAKRAVAALEPLGYKTG
jgi:hypothetical protein